MTVKVLCQPFRRGAGHSRKKLTEGGFSLIEVVIAIAVVALTFIGIIGLLGVGAVNDQASSQGTIATNIAGSILADLRSTPGNIPGAGGIYSIATSSSRYGLPLPTTVTATPSTPIKGLTAPTLSVAYFDNAANFISPLNPSSAPAGAAYVARVYPALISSVGLGSGQVGTSQYNYMVRVVVSWPAQATAVPGGSIDVTSQFLVH
jgi:hypothetical protein